MLNNSQSIASPLRISSKLPSPTKAEPAYTNQFYKDIKEAKRQRLEKESIKKLMENDTFMRKYMNESISNFQSTTGMASLKQFTRHMPNSTTSKGGLTQSESKNELKLNMLKDNQLNLQLERVFFNNARRRNQVIK